MIGGHASLEDTIVLLDQPLSAEKHQSKTPLLFQIDIWTCTFQYTDGPWILNGITLTIPKGVELVLSVVLVGKVLLLTY